VTNLYPIIWGIKPFLMNVCNIFGPDLTSIQGKMVRHTPVPVVADYVAIPWGIVERNQIVMMAADVFFVDSIAFLVTLSRMIRFVTAEHVPVRTAKSLSKHLDQVLQVYPCAGFNARTILMDGEFKKINDLMPLVVCNTTAAKEHVSKLSA
jgi:hypothetical protein